MFNWITIWLLWYSVFYSPLDSVLYKAILVRSLLSFFLCIGSLFSLHWVSFCPFSHCIGSSCPFSHCIGSFCPLFIILGQFLPFFSFYWVILPFFSFIGSFLPFFLLYWVILPFFHFIGSVLPFSGYIEDFVPSSLHLNDGFHKCSCEMVRYGNFYINGHNLLNNLFL